MPNPPSAIATMLCRPNPTPSATNPAANRSRARFHMPLRGTLMVPEDMTAMLGMLIVLLGVISTRRSIVSCPKVSISAANPFAETPALLPRTHALRRQRILAWKAGTTGAAVRACERWRACDNAGAAVLHRLEDFVTSSSDRCVFRFAPSPNGEMHLGHALSALIGYARAQACGGRFLLRIEDIDGGRSRPQFVAQIFADLAWLGIAWEEPVVLQSQRMPAYRAAAPAARGRWAVSIPALPRAPRSRRRLPAARSTPMARRSIPGLFRGRDRAEIARRQAARGEPFALRIDMGAAIAAAAGKLGGAPLVFTELGEDGAARVVEASPERWGDAVIVRKDVATSYHLAVVVDDAWQGVTHVTAGATSTRRPTCTGCCRCCSTCRRRSTTTIA